MTWDGIGRPLRHYPGSTMAANVESPPQGEKNALRATAAARPPPGIEQMKQISTGPMFSIPQLSNGLA